MTNEDYRAIKNAVAEGIRQRYPFCPHCGLELVYEPGRGSHLARCADAATGHPERSTGHPSSRIEKLMAQGYSSYTAAEIAQINGLPDD
jgi:hypothetical protein